MSQMLLIHTEEQGAPLMQIKLDGSKKEAKGGKKQESPHRHLVLLHFSFFFLFSFMPKMTMSSRKMLTKSRKRSTQCQM